METLSNHPCECGCGQFTKLSAKTHSKFGHIKGQPQRFVKGHSTQRQAKSIRTCVLCRQTKPIEEFITHKRKALGRDYRCRPCERIHRASRLSREARHYRPSKYPRKYNPIVGRASVAKYRASHPVIIGAHKAAKAALAAGRITPSPCEQCGLSPAQMHHDDYAQPLVVRWLCRKHHREHHKLHGPGRNAA